MNRITAFVAGIVCTLAAVAATLLIVVVSNPSQAAAPDDFASRFDVEVVWFDSDSPCGSHDEHLGCWQRVSPDVVYVASGLSPEIAHAVTLHEIGHVIQYRLGLPRDECMADRFALSLGAKWTGYDCD